MGFKIFQCSIYLIFIFIVMFVAYIFEKQLETFLGIISFFATRYTFNKTYHCKTVFKCLFTSIMIFVIFAIICIPNNVSILLNIILGFVITMILYLLRDYLDYKELEKLRLHIQIQKGMAINELNQFKDLLSNIEFEILKMYYCECKRLDYVANKLNYSIDNIKKIKHKALEKLQD